MAPENIDTAGKACGLVQLIRMSTADANPRATSITRNNTKTCDTVFCAIWLLRNCFLFRFLDQLYFVTSNTASGVSETLSESLSASERSVCVMNSLTASSQRLARTTLDRATVGAKSFVFEGEVIDDRRSVGPRGGGHDCGASFFFLFKNVNLAYGILRLK